jgi:hypothetical protein
MPAKQNPRMLELHQYLYLQGRYQEMHTVNKTKLRAQRTRREGTAEHKSIAST